MTTNSFYARFSLKKIFRNSLVLTNIYFFIMNSLYFSIAGLPTSTYAAGSPSVTGEQSVNAQLNISANSRIDLSTKSFFSMSSPQLLDTTYLTIPGRNANDFINNELKTWATRLDESQINYKIEVQMGYGCRYTACITIHTEIDGMHNMEREV
ncbi:MAG: hypothetical protein HQK53_14920 [Oligoflexia bacterium]|nr:hypothetical protein [Oligoflexia bacterium]